MKSKFLKMKNKRPIIIATFTALLLMVCYACLDDVWDSREKYEDRAIEHAKAWYEANKPEDIILRSYGGMEQMKIKAEWSHAFTTRYDMLEVVETDVMSEGLLLFLNKECVEKSDEANDPNYKQCYTRMVFKTNRNTGETVGFLMTVVPDLDWLEKSKFKPFMDVTYLFRSEQFGGLILFHHIDGSFSNGWRYEEGKLVAEIGSIDVDPNQSQLRYTTCNNIPIYQSYVACWEVYFGGESCGPPQCEVRTQLVGYYQECFDWGGGGTPGSSPPPGGAGYSGGGTGTGTGTGSNSPKAPDKRTDCGNGAATRSNNAKIIINNVSASYNSFMKYTSMANEYFARIDWNGSNYVMTSPISEGPNSAPVSINETTLYAMHTHTGNSEPPSPTDFITLLNLSSYYYQRYGPTGYNLQGAIVINNNTEYLISIVDRQKAISFSNSSNANIFEPYTGSGSTIFTNSTINNEFYLIVDNLNSQGYTDLQSNYTYAMSYLLDKYNTGLTISTKQRSDSYFKELQTNKTNNSYKPTICP